MLSLMAKTRPICILSIPKDSSHDLMHWWQCFGFIFRINVVWCHSVLCHSVLASFSGSMLCDAILCYVILFLHWNGETSCQDAVKKVAAFDSTQFQQLCRNILSWSSCSPVSKQPSWHILSGIPTFQPSPFIHSLLYFLCIHIQGKYKGYGNSHSYCTNIC